MTDSLELPSAGPDNVKKPKEARDERFLKKIEEIGSNLDYLDRTGIYYPFDYRIIDSLYGFRNTYEGKSIIVNKERILRNILVAINREKKLGYLISSEANDEIIQVLEELTGKNKIDKDQFTTN